MAKFLYRFHEERGEAHLSVSDVDDVTVWEVNYPDYYEDENGEMAENSTIFDDGYMKNASDISGLEKYLKKMGTIQPNDVITDDESDMEIDEENDDAEEEPYKYGDDVIEFTIPSWAVSTLINGDSSGIEDEDEEKISKFLDRTVRDYGNALFMLPNEEDLELGFKISNDIDGLGNDCVMLLLRPSKQGYASGGTTDSAVFGRFMTSEINHAISLKKVSEKKRAIKTWLANMNDYVGDVIQKRITTDNLKYALTQKKSSDINATLKTSLNALKDEHDSFAKGGTLEGHDVQIYETDDDVYDKYTVVIDGSVFGMSGGAGFNQYIGERSEYPKDVSHWGRKVSVDNIDEDFKNQIRARFEEHVMASGGTTGKIVVTIADNKIEIKNMIAYNAATLNIMRKVQAEYIGTASAQETKDYIKKELEKRIHFDGSGATADNKDRGLNMLTLDIASKALGHKGYFAEGGEIYALSDNMTQEKCDELYEQLSAKEKDSVSSLIRLGDSRELAVATIFLNRKESSNNKWDMYQYAEGGQTLGDLIFQAETKGGKYCIKVFKVADGYEVEEYKNGNCRAFGSYNNIETLTEALNYNIDGSSKIDNINYEVKQNSEGIKMLPVDKTEHPLSRKQIKEKLGHTSGYAAGGTIESKVKNRIKDAFELPLQIAIYVPSTKEKNVIISRREFEKRIDDVEKFLAQLFGGFSAVKVEGGFESSDKGLVQEDAVRVVAFASKENEHGTTFDKSFQELIEHVKNWCTEWSQESIGVEFENDLFYVDAKTKYAEGGTTPEKKVKVFEKCRITIKDVDMGGDLVYKGEHWLNKEALAKMSNKEIGDAIAKKYGLDYGNTFKYTVVKTGETKEKFEEGGMPEPFNIEKFLNHVYPDTKKLLLRNGLVIDKDFAITDGGTTDYTHFPLVLHSQGKASTVTLNYTDNTEDNFGDITYDLNDMTIEVSFPQWDVADSGSYEYELYEDGGQVSRNKEIASIIIQQIGGMNRLHMMTGAYNFQALKNGVSFRIKNAKANYIKIMLNGKDLYDVEIGRIRGNTYKVVFSENDVYNEDLKSLIERNTGMYLSFGSGGLNVGRMYRDKEGKIIRYVGNKDSDNGIFISEGGKYQNIPFAEVKMEQGGINEQAGADRVAKELYDPYTSGNPNGGYYAGIRYKGFLHDHKIFHTREEAVKWLDDYDTKSIQTPHNDEAALSKFKNLLSDEEFAKGGKTKDQPVVRQYFEDEAFEYAEGGTLHEKMNYIFKKYGGHKNEDGTYLEIEKIANDADGRIHVTSPYWNTLSEIKKREFDNDAILQKVKDKYVLISNKPYGYMAKGGKTKDQPVIRQYFEDEAFEYGKGGTVVGDKIYFTESEVKTYLRQKFNIQLEYNLEWFAKEYYSIKYNPSKKTWEEYSQYPMNKENYKGNISEDEVKKKLRHAFKIGLEHNLRSVAQIFEVRYLYSSKKYYHSITKMPDGSIQGFAKGGKVDEVHNAYVIWISDDDEAFFDGGWGSIEDAEDRVSDIEWEEDNKPRYNVFAVEYVEDYFENKNWDITRAKSYRPYGGYGEIKKATGGSVTNKVASEAKKLISGVKKKVRSIAKN